MAKLHNYYILCPLIDQKSFLGVAEDIDDEHVIITLGRNVVNKHRLSDQKQISGWTSKDHITSPVIFDQSSNNYVGVFNKNTLKIWKDESAKLDKLKKYKFPINILRLVIRNERPPLIIFADGNCGSLPYAIENRKSYESKSILKDTDEIVDTAWYRLENKEHICHILKTANGHEILHCVIRDELGDMDKSKLKRVKILRDEDVKIVGHLIHEDLSSIYIYVLWSDSKMSMYNMQTKTWKTKGTVPWVSTSSRVSMAFMEPNHLIIFGSDKDQDGAILVAYNFLLGVGSCKYPMKMYREDAKLYCYNKHIILEASNHIGMLPFSMEINRSLASLLGSHEVIQNEYPQIADWDTPTQPLYTFSTEMEELVKLGVSEGTACANLIPPLIEKKDFKSVLRVIQEFKDIPESVIAILIKYAINSIAKEGAIISINEFIEGADFESHKDEFELLNEVFKILFCDAVLIPHLRNQLTILDSLFLIRYISYLLFDSDMPLDPEYESRLFDWCTLLMDAFYQQYVVSNNNNVNHTLQHLYANVNKLVKQLCCLSDTITALEKIIHCIKSNKTEGYNCDSPSYTIELMQL